MENGAGTEHIAGYKGGSDEIVGINLLTVELKEEQSETYFVGQIEIVFKYNLTLSLSLKENDGDTFLRELYT